MRDFSRLPVSTSKRKHPKKLRWRLFPKFNVSLSAAQVTHYANGKCRSISRAKATKKASLNVPDSSLISHLNPFPFQTGRGKRRQLLKVKHSSSRRMRGRG